jgi:hypothetical protein
MATRYQVFRRIVAPVALIAAIAVLAYDTCGAEERAEVRFAVDFGDSAKDVRHVRIDLWSGDDSIGFFEKRFGEAGATEPVRWKQVVPGGALEATINLTLAGGEVVPMMRKPLRAPDHDGEVTIDAWVPGRR